MKKGSYFYEKWIFNDQFKICAIELVKKNLNILLLNMVVVLWENLIIKKLHWSCSKSYLLQYR